MDIEQQEVRLPGESSGQKKRPQRPADGQRTGVPRKPAPRPDGAAPRKKRPAAEGGAARPARSTSGAGERSAAPKKRPAASESGTRFADEAPAKRPASRTAGGSRPAAERRAPDGRPRRAPQDRTRTAAPAAGTRSRSAAAEKSSAAAKSRKVSKWRIGMTIYVILFFIVIAFAMRWIWVLCSEFEDSQPKYTIDRYVSELNSKDNAGKIQFYQDLLKEKIDVLPLSQYESSESIYNTLDIEEPENVQFSWIKSKRFTEEAPVYYIRSGELVVAEVELNTTEKTKKHDFNLWSIGKVSSMIEVASEPEYDAKITVPAGASLTINGVAVDAGLLQPCDSTVKLDEAALKYSAQPAAVSCTISGLYASPVIAAADAAGNPLTPVEEPKEGAKHVEMVFEPADAAAPDQAITARTEALTAAYINYMINEGYGEIGDAATWKNLGALDQYMINGSKLYQNMHSSAGELNWNNAYTSRKDEPIEISHLKMYSETCCTVESKYAYQLTKTRDGVTNVNDYAGTIRWTLVKAGDAWYATDNVLVQSSEGGTHSNVGV